MRHLLHFYQYSYEIHFCVCLSRADFGHTQGVSFGFHVAVMAFNCDLLLFRARGSAYHNHDWAFASLTPSTFIAREPPVEVCLVFGEHRDPGGSLPSFSYYQKSFFTLTGRRHLVRCRLSLVAFSLSGEPIGLGAPGRECCAVVPF